METEAHSAYLEGIRLFNAGEYWHAHEQWEQCWMRASEPDATFFKGIIQAAAALVHWQRGNSRGLERNWAKSRVKLCVLPSQMHGLALDMLVAEMDNFVLSGGVTVSAPVLVLYGSNIQHN